MQELMTNIGANKDLSIATQDNELIEACYSMSLNEKRLLLLVVSKVNSFDFPNSSDTREFTITAQEWTEVFGGGNTYRIMKQASIDLMSRTFFLHKKTGHTKHLSWLMEADYYDNMGRVSVVFTPKVYARLTGLFHQFTQVNLLCMSQLRSIHSVRLYELLNQFRSTGYRIIALNDFRFAMDCLDKHELTSALKRYVLMPAIKELNKKSDLKVDVNMKRDGRNITHFEFTFSPQSLPQ